ncbi:MAG TPA: hypothetical protein VJS91_07960, partial [Nitrososphaeraceae archaeon]|nr:hypothetical protein [Nitrososphaeraceae archaeon]
MPISNDEIFLISSALFTGVNIFLLKFSTRSKVSESKFQTILFTAIVTIQLSISSILFVIYGEVKLLSKYHSALFYLVIYLSLASSAVFLAIACAHFLNWFYHKKNYLVMTYAILMLALAISSISAIPYMFQVSLSHTQEIIHYYCTMNSGMLYRVHPDLVDILVNTYNVFSIISFVVAWIVTSFMLKKYAKGKNRFAYWVLVSLPLIFFLVRYEVAFYFILNNEATNILSSIDLSKQLYGNEVIENILNSNLLIAGAFFGMAFFTIAFKVVSPGQKNALILTGIGMILLFGSKDISTLVYTSYPPLGATSITFIGIASYLVYIGIYRAATLTSRDTFLKKSLREKIENNVNLLRSISSSQFRIDTERHVKSLMNRTSEWQQEGTQQEMTPEEVRSILDDVISELKARK